MKIWELSTLSKSNPPQKQRIVGKIINANWWSEDTGVNKKKLKE